MLNFDIRRKAIERLVQTAEAYGALGEATTSDAVALHELRLSTSDKVIIGAEAYVNRLANSPKEFRRAVTDFRVAIERFDHVIEAVSLETYDATVKSGVMTGAAVGTGAAVMAGAPAAAMAVATTFGTASTGTAISALSGAAATKAALAWLGGGALVAGGGGMAAGAKMLAILGGPVGWGIGGAALAGTAIWTHRKNGQIAEKATAEADTMRGRMRALEVARAEIGRLHHLTEEHATGAERQLEHLQRSAAADYRNFSREQKQELAAMINNINALAELLNEQIT